MKLKGTELRAPDLPQYQLSFSCSPAQRLPFTGLHQLLAVWMSFLEFPPVWVLCLREAAEGSRAYTVTWGELCTSRTLS